MDGMLESLREDYFCEPLLADYTTVQGVSTVVKCTVFLNNQSGAVCSETGFTRVRTACSVKAEKCLCNLAV
jgi:hypothetical protein